MASLYGYGREVNSVFQLLGNSENDITKSISWALSMCPQFLYKFLEPYIDIADINLEQIIISFQEYESENGITDIEIKQEGVFYFVIEAKRGWIMPNHKQLFKYASFLDKATDFNKKRIITLSECDYLYASTKNPTVLLGIPISHIQYRTLYSIAEGAKSNLNLTERNIINDLLTYLRGIITMQNQNSNFVYVVSLGGDSIRLLEHENKYSCPKAYKGFPKEAPNYIGFRYSGKLQSIHHVETYRIYDVDNHQQFEFNLGPSIKPNKEIKSGNIRDLRAWAYIDLLLTCDTVKEAFAKTKERNQ